MSDKRDPRIPAGLMREYDDVSDILRGAGLAGYKPMGKYWLLYQPDEKKTLLNNMKQGFKIHVGFLKKDADIVLPPILKHLIQLKIDHKVISSLEHNLDGTQRGKCIAIYVSEVTAEMQKEAAAGNDTRLKRSMALARKVFTALDQIMRGLIESRKITREIFFHRDGKGGDKYLEGATGMVGYRIGSFVEYELEAHVKGNYLRIDDDRRIYKDANAFQGITLTQDGPAKPDKTPVKTPDKTPVKTPIVSPQILDLHRDIRVLRAVRFKIDMNIVSTIKQKLAIEDYVSVLGVTGGYINLTDMNTLRNYRRNLVSVMAPLKQHMPNLFE